MITRSRLKSFLAALALAPLLAGPLPAAAPLATPLSQAASASIFGEPVVVHGERISDDQIKRFLCHSVGWQETSKFKFQVLIDQELIKRRQQGATEEDLARFSVGDAELERKLQYKKEDFLLRYPTLDFRTEVARANLSLDLYREQLRQELIFDKVFRPENPDEWPELTRAIIVEGLGDQWIDDERVSYASRLRRLLISQKDRLSEAGFGDLVSQLEQFDDRDSDNIVQAIAQPIVERARAVLIAAGVGDIPEDDPIAIEATRSTILQALNGWALVLIDEDAIYADLPEAGADAPADPQARARLRGERAAKTLMTVDKVPVLIDDVYSRIAPFVTTDQIEDAKRFLVNLALMERFIREREAQERERAAKEGGGPTKFLLTPAEFREWWPSTGRNSTTSYMEFLNLHEMLSSQVLGFPSLWAFAHYFRVLEGYRRSMAADLANDEIISTVLPMSNQVRGAAKLTVQVLFVSAFDFDKFQWKPNGWAEARKRALELKKALDDGADWKSTLELHSEWWDPPMPEMGNKPVQNFYFKGTFGDRQLTRNELHGNLGESEYRTFLYGPSATDEIFFNQKMGSIGGPYRGPKGYFIARITGKTPPTRPLDLKEPIHRQIVEQDYLWRSLNTRVDTLLRDAVASGAVKGVRHGGSFSDL